VAEEETGAGEQLEQLGKGFEAGQNFGKGIANFIDGKPGEGGKAINQGIVDAIEVIPGADKVIETGDKAVKALYELAGKDPDKAPTLAGGLNSFEKWAGEGLADLTYKALHPNELNAGVSNSVTDDLILGQIKIDNALKEKAVAEKQKHVAAPDQKPVELAPVVVEVSQKEIDAAKFAKQQAIVAKMDPHSVIVDGCVKDPKVPVHLDGKVTSVEHYDKAGITMVEFTDKMGHKRQVSWKEPMGVGPDGAPTHHPLQEMADKLKEHHTDYDKMKVAIDGKGNTDYSVGNAMAHESGHDGPGLPKDPMSKDRGRALAGAGHGL